MRFSSQTPSRSFFKQLALLALLLSAFTLLLLMFSRTFWHYEVSIASIQDPAGTSLLMEQLEQLDADYRVRKDGSILVDNSDAERLKQAGVPFGDARVEPQWTYRFFILLLLTLIGALTVLFGRQFLAILKRTPDITEAMTAEAVASAGVYIHEPVQDEPHMNRYDSALPIKLFEAEHPQTVAVYLLGLDTGDAVSAMEAMDPELRERVWERMAFSSGCDTALRKRVDALFTEKLHTIQKQMRPPEITEKMVAIYRCFSPAIRQELLSALRRGHAGDRMIALLETENRRSTEMQEA